LGLHELTKVQVFHHYLFILPSATHRIEKRSGEAAKKHICRHSLTLAWPTVSLPGCNMFVVKLKDPVSLTMQVNTHFFSIEHLNKNYQEKHNVAKEQGLTQQMFMYQSSKYKSMKL